MFKRERYESEIKLIALFGQQRGSGRGELRLMLVNSPAPAKDARAVVLVQVAALALAAGIERLVFVRTGLRIVASAMLVVASAAHVLRIVLLVGVWTGCDLEGSGRD